MFEIRLLYNDVVVNHYNTTERVEIKKSCVINRWIEVFNLILLIEKIKCHLKIINNNNLFFFYANFKKKKKILFFFFNFFYDLKA